MKLQSKNFEESLYFGCQIGKSKIKLHKSWMLYTL